MSVSSLDMLFRNLEERNFDRIPDLLPTANSNYNVLVGNLSKLSRTSCERFTPYIIETILNHCKRKHFEKAKVYVQSAREEHQKFINLSSYNQVAIQPILQVNESFPIESNKSHREDQFPDHIPDAGRPTEVKVPIIDPTTTPEGRVEHITHLPTEFAAAWDKDKVRTSFKHLFDETWSVAHEDFQKNFSDDREITIILLGILKRTFSFTKTESEKQILCMMDALNHFVVPPSEKGRKANVEHAVDDYLLQRFRIAHAGLIVSRLQTEFVNTVLPDVLARLYGRTTQPSVELQRYAREAVEVTWWMNVQIPPMMILDDINDISIYSPIIRRASNKIDYIVWPALLHSINGTLLEKGIAVFT